MRSEFEKWWIREFGESSNNDLTRSGPGYAWPSVQRAWFVWQAAWDAKDVHDDA